MADGGWRIEEPCPQCAGPVTIGEADRLLQCDYCRVRLYIATDRTVRYFLPPRDPSTDGLAFIPYWRLKGQLFTCVPFEVRHGAIDMTRRAVEIPGLPPSLGVRPQALKLRFAAPETKGSFLSPAMNGESIAAVCRAEQAKLDEIHPLHQGFVGDTVSLIFAPIRLRGAVYDAIVDRLIAPTTPPGLDAAAREASAGPSVAFLATICPNCGWDLTVDKASLVLVCTNCASAWEARGRALTRRAFECLPADFPPAALLPFWRSRVRIGGADLRSYADLVRFANLPKIVREDWEKAEPVFWSPAFKLHPDHYLRLARALTIARPDGADGAGLPEAGIFPVTLPDAGIAEIVKILLADLSASKPTFFQALDRISVEVIESRLVYVPFRDGGAELTYPAIPLSINRTLLEFGRNL